MNKKNSYFSNIVCVPSKSNVVKTNQTPSVKWKTFLYPIICQHNIPSLHTQNLHHISSHTTYDIPTFFGCINRPNTHQKKKPIHKTSLIRLSTTELLFFSLLNSVVVAHPIIHFPVLYTVFIISSIPNTQFHPNPTRNSRHLYTNTRTKSFSHKKRKWARLFLGDAYVRVVHVLGNIQNQRKKTAHEIKDTANEPKSGNISIGNCITFGPHCQSIG